MPLYEYQCRSCRERFEVLQRVGEGGEGLRCPRCSAGEVDRKLSTFAALGGGESASAGEFPRCDRPGCGTDFRCAG